jgi:cell division protein FtsB
MREFKQRQKIKSRIYSKYTIAFLFIVLALLVNGTWGIFQKMTESKGKLEASEDRYESVKKRHEALDSQIKHLGTETGLEEEIRTRYNLSREGENVIVLVDNKDINDDSNANKDKGGFWSKMSSWFH